MTIKLSPADIQAAFDQILAGPEPTAFVFDTQTESVGEVLEDLGLVVNEHGELNHRFSVKVVEPQAHHKKGDPVIWRDPEPC